MASVSPTTVRFDSVDKQDASDILSAMGLTLNGYLNMAVKQLINQRRVPFEIVLPREEPTTATRSAMILAEAKELGLIEDDSASFSSAQGAMDWLEKA